MTQAKSAGFSPTRLQKIDAVLADRYVKSGALPGYQLQIFRSGQLAHHSIIGSMDLERNKKMCDDAIFRIASMSKPITAVALMMLVEEGAIDLDDDVHMHIPSWKNMGVYSSGIPTLFGQAPQFVTTPPKRPMKVLDLLTHTSGLTYHINVRTPVDEAYRKVRILDPQTPGGLDQMIEDLSRIPLDFSPGEMWSYSLSLDVAGYLVQKLSGQRFGEFLRTRLFEPLGMKDTAFHCPSEKAERFVASYRAKPGGGLLLTDDTQNFATTVPPKLEGGGAGMVGTADDYMRFCRMLLNGGTLDGVQILSRKTVELFSINHLPDKKELSDMAPPGSMFTETNFHGVGFSLGCGVKNDIARARLPGSLGEFFWGGATSCAFWIDPTEDLAVVFMTQVLGADSLRVRRYLRTMIYSAMTE